MSPESRLAFLLCCSTTSLGCVSASGIPGGPLPRGGGASFKSAFAFPVGYGKTTIASDDGTIQGTYSDSYADGRSFFFVPTQIGLRIAPLSYIDVAADLGWRDSGIEARLGLPEGSQPLPVALTGGYRLGYGILSAPANLHPNYAYARVEAYPRLWTSRERPWYGVFTAGMSRGNRYHAIRLPPQFNSCDMFCSPGAEFVRDETRVELSLGIDYRNRKGFTFGVVIMPYRVIASGPVQSVNFTGSPYHVVNHQQDFGGLIAVTFGYALLFGDISTIPNSAPVLESEVPDQ
jgi:hypothetical protein